MRLTYGPADPLTFCKEIPIGSDPESPSTPDVLAAVKSVPYWGLVRSMEIGVYRDNKRAFDISTTNIGISSDPKTGSLLLKFQCHDPGKIVKDHAYRVEATIEFYVCV